MLEAVKSAIRAFEILELFDRCRRPLSLKYIITELGYPASSGSGLLKSLLAMGYLNYDRDRRTYMPTIRLSRIGRWAEDHLLREVALMSAMERIHSDIGEVIILGAQSDLYAQYLHLVYGNELLECGDEPLEVRGTPGSCRSLCSSGIGLAILAQKHDAEIDLLRRRANMQSCKKVSREMLIKRISSVRERGYSFSREVFTKGVGAIGMALPKEAFGRVLALGVAGNVSNLQRKEPQIVSSLRAAVSALANRGP